MEISVVRLITSAMALLNIIVIVIWMIQKPALWRYAVPVLSWVVHTLTFYIAVIFIDGFTPEQLNLWSTWIRLHALLSVFMTICAMIWWHPIKRKLQTGLASISRLARLVNER